MFVVQFYSVKEAAVRSSLPAVQGNVYNVTGSVMAGMTAKMVQMSKTAAIPPIHLLVRTCIHF